jgi:hypothetical protein
MLQQKDTRHGQQQRDPLCHVVVAASAAAR